MRKIRNQHIHSTNPGLLFARGVEQLVSDQLHRPSSNDGQGAGRKPRLAVTQNRNPAGNLFSNFLRQFVF